MKEVPRNGHFRIRIGLALTVVGLIVFLLGVDPALFGLDRSPVFGFLQISVFLIGLALMCLGGYISLATLWNNRQKTIAAELGICLHAFLPAGDGTPWLGGDRPAAFGPGGAQAVGGDARADRR